MSSIFGILSHKKLMELKNCGVVNPEFFNTLVTEKYLEYKDLVSENIIKEQKGVISTFFYHRVDAKRDASWMFPDRRDLLQHMLAMDGKSKYLTLSSEELRTFALLHHAAIAGEDAKRVLQCFRSCDEVMVDEETASNIDWLLKNAYLLKTHIAQNKGE